MTHKEEIINISLYDSERNLTGRRRFAVTSQTPVVTANYADRDQRWELEVWQRIEGRGYVAKLSGTSQWCDRGDHGTYVGAATSAQGALDYAWCRDSDDVDYVVSFVNDRPPRCLVLACVEYDQSRAEPEVE